MGEHDGNGAGLLPQSCQYERGANQDHIWFQSDKLDYAVPYVIPLVADPAKFKPDVVPVRPAELFKASLKCVSP